VWTVVFHPSAEKELGALSALDRVAALHAAEKLAALGPTLPIRIRATSAVGKA
jgi:hypothetical protein